MHKIDNQHLRAMQINANSFTNAMKEKQNAFQEKMHNAKKVTNTNNSSKPSQNSEEKEASLFAQTSLFSAHARQNTIPIKDNNTAIKEHSASNSNSMMNAVELIEKLSATILVSASKLGGTKEIHIHLKNDILPQTEVQLKLNGKNLEVQFVTNTYETSNFLSQHVSSLQNILQSKQDGLVTIAIALRDSKNTEQNSDQAILHKSSEGNSDHSGDGRSRQQRNIFEELLQKKL